MTTTCPHCGYSLTADAPVEAGDLYIDPRGDCAFRGRPIHLTRSENVVLHTLAKAGGKIVSRDQFVNRIRRKLGLRAGEPPLMSERGRGLRWAA